MVSATSKNNSVAILMATYNGAEFLEQQLDSLASQDHPHIDIWLSDNGSTDGTPEIARRKAASWKKGNFTVITRNRSRNQPGTANDWLETPLAQSRDNFISLIVNRDILADYYAFCDQDDIWDKDKLSAAIAKLQENHDGNPILYCSRTKIMDQKGRVTGLSVLFAKRPNFKNAVIQNIAAGNTIVMNRMAMNILRENSTSGGFVSHDWWAYMVITGFGGVVIYDEVPRTNYRQHGSNVIGENASWGARISRLRFLLKGRFRRWNEMNIVSLEKYSDNLPEENRQTLSYFKKLNQSMPVAGLYYLYKSGIYRQTALGQLSLYLGSLLGKI